MNIVRHWSLPACLGLILLSVSAALTGCGCSCSGDETAGTATVTTVAAAPAETAVTLPGTVSSLVPLSTTPAGSVDSSTSITGAAETGGGAATTSPAGSGTPTGTSPPGPTPEETTTPSMVTVSPAPTASVIFGTTSSDVAVGPPPSGMSRPTLFTWAHYEESDPRIRYGGTWSDIHTAPASGGAFRAADSPSYLYVDFVGTQVAFLCGVGPDSGYADLILRDMAAGGAVIQRASLDLYHATPSFGRMWTAGPLPERQYELYVEWGGRKNPDSGGTRITIDAIEVVGRIIPVP